MAWGFVWVLIPLFAIAAGAFQKYLEFKAETDQLGSSNKALEEKVEKFEAERDRIAQRLANLEAIVTSEVYELKSKDPLAAKAMLDDIEEPSDEEEVARLARRMTR